MAINDRYLDDFQFASRDELATKARARFTDRFRIEVKPERILGSLLTPQMRETLRFFGQTRSLTIAGCASLLVFTFLAVDILSPDASWMGGLGVLLLAAVGLTLSYYSVLGALWALSNSQRRPWVAVASGTLAMALGLTLPLIEANTTRVSSESESFTSCRGNLLALWALVLRYEEDTGKRLAYGSPEALRPVWERYRNTDAEAFFCPDAVRTQTLLATGISLSSAEFRDISFTGCLFEPWMRDDAHQDAKNGPPMLWEKEINHGIGGVEVYTAAVGPHRSSSSVLYRRIATFRTLVAAREAERESMAAVAAARDAESAAVGSNPSSADTEPQSSTDKSADSIRAQLIR